METEKLDIIPNANDPPSVAGYIIDGNKYSVARYYCGGKNLEEIITELAYRQADRDFKINTKGNMPKGLKS